MLMELIIETLTGTAFELRVSPFETILSVKAKIQRQEGIAIGQQHLIWQEHELDDEASLHDYGVPSGGTLRLVLGMRGGPINTRRVPVEPPSWADEAAGQSMADFMWSSASNKQVTLLVLREGDQVNFFRVMDRGDGTLTPVAESLSACSKRESREGTDEEPNGFGAHHSNGADDDSSDESSASATRRGAGGYRTKRHGGATSSSSSLTATTFHRHDTASQGTAASVAARFDRVENDEATSAQSLHLKMRMLQQQMDQMRLNRRLGNAGVGSGRKLAPLSLPPSQKFGTAGETTSDVSSSTAQKAAHDAEMVAAAVTAARGSSGAQARAAIVPPSFLTPAKPPDGPKSAFGLHVPHPPNGVPPSTRVRPLPPGMIRLPSKLPSPASTATLAATSGAIKSGLLPALPEAHLRARAAEQLPPVLLAARGGVSGVPSTTAAAARQQRCFYCHRKIGLANTYQCRCGNNYCARHRYAEVHDCPYDYKAEGRKLIQEANPVVTASKLPKI